MSPHRASRIQSICAFRSGRVELAPEDQARAAGWRVVLDELDREPERLMERARALVVGRGDRLQGPCTTLAHERAEALVEPPREPAPARAHAHGDGVDISGSVLTHEPEQVGEDLAVLLREHRRLAELVHVERLVQESRVALIPELLEFAEDRAQVRNLDGSQYERSAHLAHRLLTLRARIRAAPPGPCEQLRRPAVRLTAHHHSPSGLSPTGAPAREPAA